MKRLSLVLLLLSIVPSAQAGPKKALKRTADIVFNHVTLDLYAGGSSGFASGGTFYCRTHNPDVEGCSEHYGSARTFEVVRGVATAGAILWSEYGRKQGYKDWFVPALATAAFNTVWGVRQFRTHEKPELHDERR